MTDTIDDIIMCSECLYRYTKHIACGRVSEFCGKEHHDIFDTVEYCEDYENRASRREGEL